MNYKYTQIEGVFILIVEDIEFLSTVKGRVFKDYFCSKHPDANGNLVIGYLNEEGSYVIDSEDNLINMDEVNNIQDWKEDTC